MEELEKKTIEQLNKAPDDIRSCAIAFDGVNHKLQLLQEYMKTKKADFIIEIDAAKVEDNGKEKKRYSNEASRNAELARRLNLNEKTKEARLNIEALMKKKRIIEIDLRYEQDRFSAAKAVARILMERE